MKTHNITPIPNIQVQRGQTCKLYALSNSMEWLNNAYMQQEKPPIIRKPKGRDKPKIISLRKRAKTVTYSQVGEVYGDKNFLKLAKDSGFNNFKSIKYKTATEFCALIKSEIDKNLMPIAMFDVKTSGWDVGQPFNDSGLHEHAVVISGYYHNAEGELRFRVGQWGSTYDFSALEFAESNAQLSSTRIEEEFIKHGGRWFNVEDIDKDILKQARNHDKNLKEGEKKQIRKARVHDLKKHGTFKKRIIIAAPNGIDYRVNLKKVKARNKDDKSQSSHNGKWFYGALLIAGAIGLGAAIFTCAHIASIVLSVSLFGIFGLSYDIMLNKQNDGSKVDPSLDEDSAAPIISTDFKHIKRKPQMYAEYAMLEQKPILFSSRDIKEQPMQDESPRPESAKITIKMPRSQPF